MGLWPVLGSWLISLIAHYFIAMAGGMIIGLLPELYLSYLYHGTVLESFAPAMALTALFWGYFISQRVFRARAASWTWAIGFLWLAFGIYDETRFWNPSWSHEKTRWAFAFAEFLGPSSKCSDSECLGVVMFTWPLVTSVMYSIGASLRKRKAHPVN